MVKLVGRGGSVDGLRLIRVGMKMKGEMFVLGRALGRTFGVCIEAEQQV